jgi:hypothetical protein
MNKAKLTTKEIETKISMLAQRVQTLKDISMDITDEKAKIALTKQQEQYKKMLEEYRAELSKHNKV